MSQSTEQPFRSSPARRKMVRNAMISEAIRAELRRWPSDSFKECKWRVLRQIKEATDAETYRALLD